MPTAGIKPGPRHEQQGKQMSYWSETWQVMKGYIRAAVVGAVIGVIYAIWRYMRGEL